MPQIDAESNPSHVSVVWLILASILLVMALGAVLYYLSGNGFNTENAKQPGTIQLEQSIHDVGQPVQWACNPMKLNRIDGYAGQFHRGE